MSDTGPMPTEWWLRPVSNARRAAGLTATPAPAVARSPGRRFHPVVGHGVSVSAASLAGLALASDRARLPVMPPRSRQHLAVGGAGAGPRARARPARTAPLGVTRRRAAAIGGGRVAARAGRG